MSPSDRVPRTRFHLNLPEDLHSQLRDRAAGEQRSINSLIVWLLRRQLDTDATAMPGPWVANYQAEGRR